MKFDQARSALPLLRRQRVLNGFHSESLLLEPHSGVTVQRCHFLLRCVAQQTLIQDLGEEMVIAIPTPFFIQRHHKQIGALKVLQ